MDEVKHAIGFMIAVFACVGVLTGLFRLLIWVVCCALRPVSVAARIGFKVARRRKMAGRGGVVAAAVVERPALPAAGHAVGGAASPFLEFE